MTVNSSDSLAAGPETATVTPRQTPHLVFAAAAITGHMMPLLQIAEAMIQRGYDVSFVTGQQFASQLRRIGVEEHVPIPDALAAADMALCETIPVGFPRFKWEVEHLFVDSIPASHRALHGHLERLAAAKPGRQVILVFEAVFFGHDALFHGAPLPKGYDSLPRCIIINIVAIFAGSVDTGPFSPGLPPDSTPSGRARNKLLRELYNILMADVTAARARVLKECGATREPKEWCFDSWLTLGDVTLQMCSPSLEYERSDMPPGIKFAGALPPKPLPDDLAYPPWWGDLDGSKRVVAVAQGTVAVNYADLVVPTMHALAGRDDTVVVVLLGIKGATLPADVEVPTNARVLDYFPYDAVLARADVFVQNAGYGGIVHAVMQGVPLVVAGVTEDKAENSMRVAHAGIGVNLGTSTPSPDQVRAAVDEVLAHDKYRRRVLEVKRENEELDALGQVERQIVEFTQ